MQTFLIVGLLASRAAEVAELPHHQAALDFKRCATFQNSVVRYYLLGAG